MPEQSKPRMLSVSDIISEYGFAEYTVRAWIWSHKLPFIRAGKGGGKYYVSESNLIRYLNSSCGSEVND